MPDYPTVEAQIKKAFGILQKYEADLLKKQNVVGVGIGFRQEKGDSTRQVTVVVNVSHKVPLEELKPTDAIPSMLGDMPVDVVETGTMQAF